MPFKINENEDNPFEVLTQFRKYKHIKINDLELEDSQILKKIEDQYIKLDIFCIESILNIIKKNQITTKYPKNILQSYRKDTYNLYEIINQQLIDIEKIYN